MFSALWMMTAAMAAPTPMVGVHAVGVVAGAGSDAGADDAAPTSAVDLPPGFLSGAGGGFSAGLNLGGPVWAELSLDAGWSEGNVPRLAPLVQLRAFLTPRDGKRADGRERIGALSVVAGVGADIFPEPSILVHGGLAADFFVGRHYAVRVEGGAITHTFGDVAGRIGVGFVWSPRHPPPVPPPEVPVTSRWVGYPVCDWQTDDVSSYLASLDADATSTAVGGQGASAQADDAEQVRGLVVVGSPGDELLLPDDVAVPFDAHGVVALPSVQGQALRVRGGGRLVDVAGTRTFAGHARWTRVPEPQAHRIAFAQGSDVVSPSVRAILTELAGNTAGWTWTLTGSYSPEGVIEDNTTLALSRAVAVAGVLIELGVPPEQVVVVGVDVPEASLSAADQRAVYLKPVPPGGAP